MLLAGGDERTQVRDIQMAPELAKSLWEMNMSKTQTRPWDIVDSLDSDERIVAYLEAALEEDDAALVAATLGDIARAKGMSEIARQTGLERESLYKALSPEGGPEFSTVMKVVRALGLRLHAAPDHSPA